MLFSFTPMPRTTVTISLSVLSSVQLRDPTGGYISFFREVDLLKCVATTRCNTESEEALELGCKQVVFCVFLFGPRPVPDLLV